MFLSRFLECQLEGKVGTEEAKVGADASGVYLPSEGEDIPVLMELVAHFTGPSGAHDLPRPNNVSLKLDEGNDGVEVAEVNHGIYVCKARVECGAMADKLARSGNDGGVEFATDGKAAPEVYLADRSPAEPYTAVAGILLEAGLRSDGIAHV